MPVVVKARNEQEASPSEPAAARRRIARRLRMAEALDPSLTPPERLLRQPSAVMFLLAREAFRLGHARRQRAGPGSPEALRFPQYAVLACLEEFGPASQREVSDRLRFDPSDLVSFVDALERAGFVVRERDRRDRRRYALTITPEGRRALRRRDQDAERFNGELFAALEADEREKVRALLLRALAHHDPRMAAPGSGPGLDREEGGPTTARPDPALHRRRRSPRGAPRSRR